MANHVEAHLLGGERTPLRARFSPAWAIGLGTGCCVAIALVLGLVAAAAAQLDALNAPHA